MSLRRTTAAFVVGALLLAACAGDGGLVDGVQDVASDIADGGGDGGTDDATGGESSDGDGDATSDGQTGQDGDATDGTQDAGAGDGSTDGTGDGDGSDSAGGDDGAPGRVEADDLGPVGANGKPMLRGDHARLVIEVDVQSCTSADQGALDHLASVLRGVVDKPAGIEFRGGNTFESDRRQWTVADLRASAEANRTTRSSGDEVSMYLQYVCGAFHVDGQESTAIGVAYNGSEIGVFPQRWNDGIGVLLGSNRAVERAVLVHETGHLFGLVNLTYTSEIAHEDPEHPGHSDSRSSAMYWAIESTAIGQVFSGPPPDTFDEADRADLAGLQSGRY